MTNQPIIPKTMICEIIKMQARINGNGYIVDLLEFDLTDDEILILLRAVHANPILKSYNPAIGFCGEHVRFCNNYRAVYQQVLGLRKKMSFDEAKQVLLNHKDEDELPLIRKYAQ